MNTKQFILKRSKLLQTATKQGNPRYKCSTSSLLRLLRGQELQLHEENICLLIPTWQLLLELDLPPHVEKSKYTCFLYIPN